MSMPPLDPAWQSLRWGRLLGQLWWWQPLLVLRLCACPQHPQLRAHPAVSVEGEFLCGDGHHAPHRHSYGTHHMMAGGRACNGWWVVGCTTGHFPTNPHRRRRPAPSVWRCGGYLVYHVRALSVERGRPGCRLRMRVRYPSRIWHVAVGQRCQCCWCAGRLPYHDLDQ